MLAKAFDAAYFALLGIAGLLVGATLIAMLMSQP